MVNVGGVTVNAETNATPDEIAGAVGDVLRGEFQNVGEDNDSGRRL